jgi:hypothetical protein
LLQGEDLNYRQDALELNTAHKIKKRKRKNTEELLEAFWERSGKALERENDKIIASMEKMTSSFIAAFAKK